jgi:hypothetical protein
VFDEDIVIKNYINFEEDGRNFETIEEKIRNTKDNDRDYNEELDEYKGDHFEEALDTMRKQKLFGVGKLTLAILY